MEPVQTLILLAVIANLAVMGSVLGFVGAIVLNRVLARFLASVGTAEPQVFVVVSLVLIATTLSACWIPARRASRVDPMVTLRCE